MSLSCQNNSNPWGRLSNLLNNQLALTCPKVPSSTSCDPVTNIPPKTTKTVSQQKDEIFELHAFSETLAQAELDLRKELVSSFKQKSDVHRLLINVCERSIFPSLLTCAPDNQKVLLRALDHWLEHLLPVFSEPSPSNSSPGSAKVDEWTVYTIRALAEFLQDYRKAVQLHEQPWKGRAVSPISPEAMDKQIASTLTNPDISREQILERLAKELLISANLEPSKPFCESAARLLQQTIDRTLQSSLPADLMHKILEDETLTEGMSYKEAVSSNESLPPEMLDALVNMADQLIELGNPDIAIRSAKFCFLHSFIVRGVGRAISRFSVAPKQELDIPCFVLHLLSKYSSQDFSSTILSPDELSKKLSARILEMAVLDKACSRLAKMSISAFQQYSPLLNVPATAQEMAKQLFLLIQRPESMSAFIYEYLLKRVVIPKLTEQNAAKKEMHAIDSLPQSHHPFFHRIGVETSAFLALFLKDYVYAPFIKESPLSGLALSTLQEGVLAFLPNAIASSLLDGTKPNEQGMYCNLLEATTHFLEDFIIARKAASCALGNTMRTHTRQEREAIIHKEMNRVRMVRGAPLFKRDDKERKLRILTQHLLKDSQFTSQQKLQLEQILPRFLEKTLAQIGPPLLHQILFTMLSSKQNFEKAPLSGLSNAWETNMTERWNKSMIQLIRISVRLSESQNVASETAVPLLQKLLDVAGKEIASVVSTPSAFFDPAGQLNLFRKLKAALWTEGATGQLIPTAGPNYSLTRAQKKELRNNVTKLIQSQTLPVELIPSFGLPLGTGLKKVAGNFTETLSELIENPVFLETFLYQYVMGDSLFEASSDALTTGGLHFELCSKERPTIELALEEPNVSLLMSQLQTWKILGLPRDIDSLQEVIGFLSQNNHLAPQDVDFLFSLLKKDETALVSQYIDYAFHRLSRQNTYLRDVSPEQLVIDFVQRSLGILVSPDLVASFHTQIIDKTTSLTEERVLCCAVEMALTQAINDEKNTTQRQFLSDTLVSLRKAPSPLNFLSRFLSSMKQVNYWENTIATLHQTKNVDLFAFYEAFTKATSHLLGPPFTLRQRAILCTQLQKPLKTASWQNALHIPTDWKGPMSVRVCPDSMDGIQQKLRLLQKAQFSIVLSGSYFGGAPFNQALSIIREKLRTNPNFKVYILGSEYMLKPENFVELERLKNAYSNQFHLVLNHEVNPFTNPHTGRFFLMCNHVKLLVIDEGTDFIIGGSGIEERWANHDGTHNINPGQLNTQEPLAFRDTDYVMHSEGPNGLGKLLHHQLLELCAHCCYMKDEDLAKRYFDPRFYPISKTKEISSTPSPSGTSESTRIEFFATNPEDAKSNGFEQRLIQLIENAQERIIIDHMYFHPTDALLQSLIRASNRGISIILLTNQDQPDTPGTHKLFVPRSRYLWKKLFEGRRKTNVCVFEYLVPYTTLHKKIMVIDNCVATGSSNCGLLSMEGLNHEYNVIIHSSQVVDQTMAGIDVDIEKSRFVSDEEVTTISPAEKMAGIATIPLQYLF